MEEKAERTTGWGKMEVRVLFTGKVARAYSGRDIPASAL